MLPKCKWGSILLLVGYYSHEHSLCGECCASDGRSLQEGALGTEIFQCMRLVFFLSMLDAYFSIIKTSEGMPLQVIS